MLPTRFNSLGHGISVKETEIREYFDYTFHCITLEMEDLVEYDSAAFI